jgi:hypothetical protein
LNGPNSDCKNKVQMIYVYVSPFSLKMHDAAFTFLKKNSKETPSQLEE